MTRGKFDEDKLKKLLEEAQERVEKMTPAEKEEMLRKQRESWSKQDMD